MVTNFQTYQSVSARRRELIGHIGNEHVNAESSDGLIRRMTGYGTGEGVGATPSLSDVRFTPESGHRDLASIRLETLNACRRAKSDIPNARTR